MKGEHAFASIDVGTTKICTIVAEAGEDTDVQIIGVGIAPAQGLRKGIVVNIDETVESIRTSVEKAERSSGFKIVAAHVGIAGNHIGSLNNRGVVAIAHHDRLISEEDVHRVLEAARTVSIPSNREVIHVIPRSYTLDGQEGVKNPVGMHGFRLDVETHIVTGATTSIQNLTKCIQQVGIEINDLVLEPLASSEAVLTDEEREMGVILADIGGGTTDMAVFIDGAIWHTGVLPVGGYQLTNDIAIGLRTPFATAEDIKTRYGYALSSAIDPEETFEATTFGSEERRSISRRHLCEIVEARATEILEMILMEIKRSGYDGMLPAGLVLTGGTANLKGIDALARNVLQLPARVGYPRGIHGLVETVYNPAYATSVGLLLWAMKYGGIERRPHKHHSLAELFKQLTFWVRELLPQ